MFEDQLKSPSTRRRLRAGPLAPHLERFAEWMHRQRYRPTTMRLKWVFLATWSDWRTTTGADADDHACALDSYVDALAADGRLRYADRPRGAGVHKGTRKTAVVAASMFVRCLRESGLAAVPARPPTRLETWPILREYDAWILQHGGLAVGSARLYEIVIADLLVALGDDPASYTAQAVREFVLARARPHGLERGGSIVCAVRSYLRFLSANGRCPPDFADVVPRFGSWKLSTVPRHIEPTDLQRVLDACVTDSVVGRRDRAIVYLLARLGLRGGDVQRLTFANIDWKNGRIAVSGKSRRQEWLPLPQEVGDAILAYVRDGRPKLDVPEVFITVVAPFRPLAAGSLANVTATALRRAGIAAPSFGTHLFRHSAATAMLREGASLSAIGAVLRHRSPDTTMLYAKVDYGLLSEVAQPWPDVSPC